MKRACLRVTWLGCLLLAASMAMADGITRSAIAIRHPAPETPLETAGTDLAPEVPVKVVVDENGVVSSVEVLQVSPSTEFDALFRQAAEETLRGWRYAPELVGGRAVETTLRWTVQFPAREQPRDDSDVELVWRRMSNEGTSLEELQRKLLTMQLEQRAKHLEGQAKLALSVMGDERHEFRSRRFIVYSDATDDTMAEIAAGNLESLFNVLHDLLGPDIRPQPEPYRIVSLVYASELDFDWLSRSIRGEDELAGFYYPAGLLAFHLQMHSNERLLSVLLHEGTHAYLDRYVSRPGVVIPRWFHEGFAEYVGNSRIKDGELIPGRTRKVEHYRGAGYTVRGRAQVRFTLDEVKQAVRKGEAIELTRLISAGRTEFDGKDRRAFYTMAWILVHFMRHGEPSWTDTRFTDFLLYISEGYPALAAFSAIYGDPADVQPRFLEYVRSF